MRKNSLILGEFSRRLATDALSVRKTANTRTNVGNHPEPLALRHALEALGDVLLGVMGTPATGPSISHTDGMWTLWVPVPADPTREPEVLCRHERLTEFLELCAEYSDYAFEGDT